MQKYVNNTDKTFSDQPKNNILIVYTKFANGYTITKKDLKILHYSWPAGAALYNLPTICTLNGVKRTMNKKSWLESSFVP